MLEKMAEKSRGMQEQEHSLRDPAFLSSRHCCLGDPGKVSSRAFTWTDPWAGQGLNKQEWGGRGFHRS